MNCSAVPETLLESELFGHTKGSFTGATESRTGLFQKSNGGTLFLDEVADMPVQLQPKLLRALQERVVRPVGSDREIPYDARIVAATNRDLATAVEEGRFREDLLFRLDVISLHLTPLRSRGSDILLLAQRFVEAVSKRLERKVAGISKTAAEKLLGYDWPGNVRELQNAIERGVALARFDEILVEDLPERIQNHDPKDFVIDASDPASLLPMEEIERRYILRVLSAVGGNKSLAARTLGFDRKTLYRKLERYAVDPDRSDRNPA